MLGIVNGSFQDYLNIQKNKPVMSKLFTSHSEADPVRVHTFKNEIAEAIKDKKSNIEVLKMIADFLEIPGGNKAEKSFKKIFSNNMHQIADCPAGVLYDRMKEAKNTITVKLHT